MNYLKIYNSLIYKKKNDVPIKQNSNFLEKHHIIPKCLNGTDSPDNLVYLTLREHFLAHLLLYKIYCNTKYKYKLLHAVFCMIDTRKYNSNIYLQSKKYVKLRKEYYSTQEYRSFTYSFKGKHHSKKTIEKIKSKHNKNPKNGSKNIMYNKIWIFNTVTFENKSWIKNIEIPKGWIKGPYFKIQYYFRDLLHKENLISIKKYKKYSDITSYDEYLKIRNKLIINKQIEELRKSHKQNIYYMMWNWYKKYGFLSTAKQFNYKFTHQDFCYLMRNNIKTYNIESIKIYEDFKKRNLNTCNLLLKKGN